jgi:hypothetical protein
MNTELYEQIKEAAFNEELEKVAKPNISDFMRAMGAASGPAKSKMSNFMSMMGAAGGSSRAKDVMGAAGSIASAAASGGAPAAFLVATPKVLRGIASVAKDSSDMAKLVGTFIKEKPLDKKVLIPLTIGAAGMGALATNKK